jgi:site-specific DNA recombinase
MTSTNGHGSKRAILYARVSTDEQARSGYSLAQQMEALKAYAAQEGYEVLEEVTDPRQSGASLERPGMDRVRDLVAGGTVSVVLAQDRDRFSREPAYAYLLKKEFEEHGTKIRSLKDRGDDSPEGELMDGVFDQFAKFERAKTAERSRRGKLRKAREGKIIATSTPDYGFKYTASRDGYKVDEATMPTVRRIFRMVALEGYSLRGIKRRFEAEELLTPAGKKHWSETFIREVIKDDVYRPHSFEEIKALIAPEVAARLDPQSSYGIYWFNRKRHTLKQVAQDTLEGRVYRKKKKKSVDRPRNEWIAVPVPDAGIPRELVDGARVTIKDNCKPSYAGRRFWELSGGILYCGSCGRRMARHRKSRWNHSGKEHFYYRCHQRWQRGREACRNHKLHRADKVEGQVWEIVSNLLQNPEQLRTDIDKMIELERNNMCSDPEQEQQAWLEKIAKADHKRARYQEMAADGLITLDELRIRLSELANTRSMAERELKALQNHKERMVDLETDREALLDSLVSIAPDALDSLRSEERHHLYKMLKLKVVVCQGGALDVSGTFGYSLAMCNFETPHGPLVRARVAGVLQEIV